MSKPKANVKTISKGSNSGDSASSLPALKNTNSKGNISALVVTSPAPNSKSPAVETEKNKIVSSKDRKKLPAIASPNKTIVNSPNAKINSLKAVDQAPIIVISGPVPLADMAVDAASVPVEIEQIQREALEQTAALQLKIAEDTRIASELANKQAEEEEAVAAAAVFILKENGNGMVRLKYEMYDQEFPIVDGSTTQENIDEEYALSFVMPNCLVHLSTLTPTEKRQADIANRLDIFVAEEPRGTYRGLQKGNVYFVYVEQESEQLKRDQLIAKQKAELLKQPKEETLRQEGCSCLYGNPCLVSVVHCFFQ